MGDRHGGRFARRGRALNPPRPQVDAHLGVGLRWRATVFRCRGAGCRIRLRAGTLPTAKASRHGAKAKEFAPREKALLGESLPTRRTSKRICPRRNSPLGEGLPTRRTSERICATREHAPRRRPLDTAHERKDLSRAGTLPTAKASRHGTRAKGFAPRRNTPRGEGLTTRRTSERICPARERSPRRRPPDTARRRKDLPRGGSPSPHVPTNGGPPSTDGQPEKHPFGGVAPTARGRCRVHSPKKNKTTP